MAQPSRLRGVYDLDLSKLTPLPSANDEARAAGTLPDSSTSTILLGPAATELAAKQARLQDYDVLHFAVHGVVSTKEPSRSALLLRSAGSLRIPESVAQRVHRRMRRV